MLVIFLILAVALLLVVFHFSHKWSSAYLAVEKLHYPKDYQPLPLIGNAHIFSTDSFTNHQLVMKIARTHDRMYRIWMFNKPFFFIYDAKDCETLLSSTTHIQKTDPYKHSKPWIGTGLLTSSGTKWKSRRKIITPTFHFKVLESYVDVFVENDKIFIDLLSSHLNGPEFDIVPYCNNYALDNICESAMRVEINAQRDKKSQYVQAIKNMCYIINTRFFRPHLGYDFIFNASSLGKLQRDALHVIHSLTWSAIRQRKQNLSNANVAEDNKEDAAHENRYSKKKLAFLDMLLDVADKEGLSDEDIREEVDTFMFEGHDTTTSGLSFVLYCLSQHQDIQDKVYAEVMELLGDSDKPAGYKNLQEMKYLERVIKESLRMYPSVPIIGRHMHEDFTLSDGSVLPKGSRAHLILPLLHKNPNYWNEPEKFNPDNFLPEAVAARHPFAFIPFSAGPRNCIGQKFAMLELKSCITAVVRRFKLLPCSEQNQAQPYTEIVYASKTGLKLRLLPRIL